MTDAANIPNVSFRIKYQLWAACCIRSYAAHFSFQAVTDFSKREQHTQTHNRNCRDDIQWPRRKIMSMAPFPFLLPLSARAVVRMFVTPCSV